MQKHHPEKVDEFEFASRNRSYKRPASTIEEAESTTSQQKLFEKRILQLTVEQMLPFQTVTSESFKNLFKGNYYTVIGYKCDSTSV